MRLLFSGFILDARVSVQGDLLFSFSPFLSKGVTLKLEIHHWLGIGYQMILSIPFLVILQ